MIVTTTVTTKYDYFRDPTTVAEQVHFERACTTTVHSPASSCVTRQRGRIAGHISTVAPRKAIANITVFAWTPGSPRGPKPRPRPRHPVPHTKWGLRALLGDLSHIIADLSIQMVSMATIVITTVHPLFLQVTTIFSSAHGWLENTQI
jgi:hypothetical protein